MYFVYRYPHPLTGITGYVGITNNPNTRHQQHLTSHSSTNKKKNAWFEQLLSEGLVPKMEIIEIVYGESVREEKEQAIEREKYWIGYYLAQGAELCNSDYTRPHKRKSVPAQRTQKSRKIWPMPEGEELIKFTDAAQMLGVKPSKFRRLINDGYFEEFPQTHGKVLFRKSDIERHMRGETLSTFQRTARFHGHI